MDNHFYKHNEFSYFQFYFKVLVKVMNEMIFTIYKRSNFICQGWKDRELHIPYLNPVYSILSSFFF